MLELENCPFCGAYPLIGVWEEGAAQGHADATAIECSSDLFDCRVNPSVCGYTRDEAIAAWNRRTAPEGEG